MFGFFRQLAPADGDGAESEKGMAERILRPIFQVDNDLVILIVVIGLVALFFWGYKGKISKPMASGLMISLGVLGTFWGILIALEPLQFTPDEINDSVQELLNGMKTAFITSFLGLAFAILSKIKWGFDSAKSQGKPVNPVHKDMNERLDAIKQAISGDDDSSMVSQLKILRADNLEGFRKLDGLSETIREALVKNLKETMEKLAADLKEVIADQLGGQLEKLIADINKALVEQFGKTFVEFNQAVQALNKWQEDHREQVEKLTVAFDESAKGIAQIRNDLSAISPIMAKLQQAVEAANAQVQELDERLKAFADMKKQAEESFPMIKENLDRIGEDLQKSASTLSSQMSAMQNNMSHSQRELNRIIAESVEQSLKTFDSNIKEEVGRMTKHWGENLTSVARKCAETIDKVNRSRLR